MGDEEALDNQLYNNRAGGPVVPNDLRNGWANVNAERNWWGTSDATAIADRIWDFFDESGLSTADFTPFLTGPLTPRAHLPLVAVNRTQ